MTRITKNGIPLLTMEDWRIHAGPKSAIQWKAGRSAMESARAWLEPEIDIPTEIESLIQGHPDFGPFNSWSAEPEARVVFDDFGGEPANLDVLLLAEDRRGPIVVAVEAKADETFGGTVTETMRRAEARLADKPGSKGVARLQYLLRAILHVNPDDHDAVGGVRYQLLTATAAALAEAGRRGAERAVVVVHEFITDLTDDRKQEANARDFEAFLEAIPGSGATEGEALVGPFALPGPEGMPLGTRVYFGKVSRSIRDG